MKECVFLMLLVLNITLDSNGLLMQQKKHIRSNTLHHKINQNLRLQDRIGSENHDSILRTIVDRETKCHAFSSITNTESLWNMIKAESVEFARDDIKASSFMSNAILSERSLDDVIIDYVANQLDSPYFLATEIRNLFADVRSSNSNISELWTSDLIACTLRDKKLPNAVSTLLFSKGFQALVTHRVASALWYTGRDGLARCFQSLSSRIFGADIHPACRIGWGCYISGASGVVIGETCVLGNDCSVAQSVTLGSTGKERCDRHPKIGNNVRIKACATVLGNIALGDHSVVEAGSVVMKPVAAFTRVGGVPAKLIGPVEPAEACS